MAASGPWGALNPGEFNSEFAREGPSDGGGSANGLIHLIYLIYMQYSTEGGEGSVETGLGEGK